MTTTTLRIDDELKARVAAAAKRAGKTTHAFILEAIAQVIEQSELDDEFHGIADERLSKVLTPQKTVPWDAAKGYLEARSRGEHTHRPAARKLTR